MLRIDLAQVHRGTERFIDRQSIAHYREMLKITTVERLRILLFKAESGAVATGPIEHAGGRCEDKT